MTSQSEPSSPKPNYLLFVGIDIAARTFTASRLKPAGEPDKALSFKQDPADYERLRNWLVDTDLAPQQLLILMEATGTYGIMLATFLHEQGFAIAVINPAQAHNFVRSLPKRPKNDLMDAKTLALMASSHQPPLWTPPPAIYHQLQQRLTQRASLMDIRQQIRNQLHALEVCGVGVPEVQTRYQTLISTLDQQLNTLENELEEVIKQDPAWLKSIELIQSIPGVGMVSAYWLVVATLNLSSCQSVEALTNYVGLAPMERSSGTSVRGRSQVGQGGHQILRNTFYMAALSATRYNQVIKTHFEKLRSAGKPKKVAYCACARKLLHIAFALVKKGEAFDVDYTRSAKTTQAQSAQVDQNAA